MSNIIKQPSPQELQSWGVSPDTKIEYYDGKILVVSDSEPEAAFPIAAKAGMAALFGVAVFTHAPLVGATMFAYAVYKIGNSIADLYGGDHGLTSKLERDLNAEVVPEGWVPMPQVPDNQSVRITTQLGESSAIDVAAETSDRASLGTQIFGTGTKALPAQAATVDDPWQPEPEQKTWTKETKPKRNALDALLASPYVSRAFFGAQRTGKSYLAAVASKELNYTKKTKTFHINLLSYVDLETGICEDDAYWSHAVKSVRGDLATLPPDEAIPLIEDAINLIHEWFASANAILILDEVAYTGSTTNAYGEQIKPLMKAIADKIAALSSGGIKRNQAIWTIAPEFVAGGLTQDTLAIKKLQLCYVTLAPNRFVDWNGSRIGFSGELFDQVKRNYPITEAVGGLGCDRICYVNNQWLPVGDLPAIKPAAPVGGSEAKK